MSAICCGRERRAVEIEGQFVRADEGAFLRRFLAHHFVQGPMEQVRDGVVALDGVAATSQFNVQDDFVSDVRTAHRFAVVIKCKNVLPDFCVFDNHARAGHSWQ